MSASNDESESVDQFLARVASLSHKKDDEEAERARKMEDDMMQARRERHTRRAERARSISPVKTGPAAASLPGHRVGASPRERSIEPPVTLTPRSQSQTPSRTGHTPQQSVSERFGSSPPLEHARPLPQPPSPDSSSSPSFPATNATALSRSGTLSWQQRPLSRGTGSVRARPFSGSRSPVRTQPESPSKASSEHEEPTPSRKDIAASLSSRDPSWFRQTQDRGIGSAAYRKPNNQQETADSFGQPSLRLAGMVPEGTNTMPARTQPTESYPSREEQDKVPEPNTPSMPPNAETQKQGTERSLPTSSFGATPLLNANSLKASDTSGATNIEATLDRSSSILGPGRSPSPTKGLGGFVQSAMMRRSDSVSKRWSVQANAGLKRGDSIASNRPVFSPPATSSAPLGHARTLSREPRGMRDGTSSPLSSSRPSSSHEPTQQDQSASQTDHPGSHTFGATKAAFEQGSPTTREDRPSTPPQEPSLSRSPSKTLDPRRWSPTKASWLESALSKPESPRPAASKPEPPAWKVGMQQSKSQKDRQESPNRPTSSFDPVSTGGLLRSPPPGAESRPVPLFGDSLAKHSRQDSSQLVEAKPTPENKADRFVSSATTPKPAGTDVARPIESDSSINLKEARLRETRTAECDERPDERPPADTKPNFRASVDKKPPALKPKPQTPPKTDFRANLKTRSNQDTTSQDKEPEFKAVFGKLKRTQTQNYVAPDVLKDNITRGKAALNVTGGPQQTKRVDEFKESILQKKEAMKQGGGSAHKKTESQNQEKPAPGVPEALARRKTLHKAKPSDADLAPNEPYPYPRPVPEKPAARPEDTLVRRQETKSAPEPEPKKTTAPPALKSKIEDTSKPDSKFPVSQKSDGGIRTGVQMPKPASKAVEGSPHLQQTMLENASGKLAARLNPALAGLIARGNSPKPQEESPSFRPLPSDVANVGVVTGRGSFEDSSGTLQHMTKARARGPKRRAPKAEGKNDFQKTEPTAAAEPIASQPAPVVTEEKPVAKPTWKASPRQPPKSGTLPLSPKKSPIKAPLAGKSADREAERPATMDQPASRALSESSPAAKARPLIASKSPELRRVSNKMSAADQKDEKSPTKATCSAKTFDIATDGTSQNSVNLASTPSHEASWRQETRPLPLTPSKSKQNSPPKPSDSSTGDSHVNKIKPKPAGLGLNLNNSTKQPTAAGVLTPPSDSDLPAHGRRTAAPDAQDETSVSKIVQEFLGSVPRAADRAEFDTEAYLRTRPNSTKRIKTISKQIWEINGDGKRSALPPQQEHILYEECMYLCVHAYEPENASKSTEVYLWAGDSVPDAAIEDAQLFCRKIARENSAKLEVVRQGKESSELFSALGGIVIIRKTKSSALYMLCGRRHHGHVAFDEVRMSAAHLCSGFPFLISAQFGKLYLWKGQGSGTDEISAARLISMDLSLTGEIEEISEGQEPAAFWEAFSESARFQPSEMWSIRSMEQHKGFPCRLYRVEMERPKSSGGFWGLRASSPPKASNKASLQEVSPFIQKDLDVGSVHILDAYANVYVLPGSSATPKPAEFVSALHIAQEIAVLAPSVEDRSLLPPSEVVFGEPPLDFKAAFRKWTPDLNVNVGKGNVCVDVAEVLRILN